MQIGDENGHCREEKEVVSARFHHCQCDHHSSLITSADYSHRIVVEYSKEKLFFVEKRTLLTRESSSSGTSSVSFCQ